MKKTTNITTMIKAARREAQIKSGNVPKLGTQTHKSIKDYVRKPKHFKGWEI